MRGKLECVSWMDWLLQMLITIYSGLRLQTGVRGGEVVRLSAISLPAQRLVELLSALLIQKWHPQTCRVRDNKPVRNIAAKTSTLRTATAEAVVRIGPRAGEALRQNALPKGDPFPVAKIAAIQAAKDTPRIIPY